jgi:1-acyl-sn-glycerol-3-phosphate acyltransferase
VAGAAPEGHNEVLPSTPDPMTGNTEQVPHDTRGRRIRRRLVSVPRVLVMLVGITVTLPLLLTGAGIVDLVRFVIRRRPWVAVRMVAFFWVYLFAESVGIVRFFLDWVRAGFGRRREWMVDRAWAVQAWWARTLFNGVRRLFGLRFVIEGEDLIEPGPIIAMFRHASIVDNLLPAVLVSDRHGIKLRWLIKRELLSDPGLDIGGNRLPNYFVDRSSRDTSGELARIRALATGLGVDEGVLIYPEGTRFTPAKQQRALQRLGSSPTLLEKARPLRHVLPPRIGGATTLLDAGYDVLFCGHHGLGGFAQIGDIWSGDMVGRTISVRFWRVPAADIPQGRRERIDWLFGWWQTIDDWIDARMTTP